MVWDGKDPKKYADGFKVKAGSGLTMVSAVFHSSLDTRSAEARAPRVAAALAANEPVAARCRRRRRRGRASTGARFWLKVLPPLVGIGAAGRHLGRC